MSLKQNFLCEVCSKILEKPVSVPCKCNQICKEHVDKEIRNKKYTMTCPTCKETYDIPEKGFIEMKKIKDVCVFFIKNNINKFLGKNSF